MKTVSIFCIILLSTLTACKKLLDEETFSSLGPSNYYHTADDAETLLNGVYANSGSYRDMVRDYITFGEVCTDILIERNGGINAEIQPVEDFDNTTTNPWLNGWWVRNYSAIYRANVVLDKVPQIEMDDNRKAEILAEARFLRAFNYFYLYDLFGPVPIITTSETTPTDRPERPTKEEFSDFIENEFLAVSKELPATQQQYGRATSGAALGFLCKYYLNNKEWQKAAETAKQIMDTHVYSLFTEGNRTDLFNYENEGNNEFIYVAIFPDNPKPGDGNSYLSHAAPNGYPYKYPPHVIFAADFKIRSAFLNTFEPGDERKGAILTQFVNTAGDTVHLGKDDARSFKFPESPDESGDITSIDFPLLRYADILLSRAEALNEVQGPNQESIDLINQIRAAAGLGTIDPDDYPTKEALRDHILDERGWEFHTEGLRRQDLIRMGKFIEMARERGKNAQEYHVLFPIPQAEIDKNPNLKQNPGYD